MSARHPLLTAYLWFRVAEFGVWIGLTPAAYAAGGVREATVVMLLRLAPAALAAPGVGGAVGRWGAARVLRTGLLAQAAGMAWAAAWFAIGGGSQMAALGLGALTVGWAVERFGPRAALLAPAVLLAMLTLAAARTVLRSERHADRPVAVGQLA